MEDNKMDDYFDFDLERMRVAVEGDTIYKPEGMTVREWLDWLKTVDNENKEL